METTPKFNLPVGGTGVTTPPTPSVQTPTLTDLTIGTEKFKVNSEGNAIDDSGKIVKTKTELEVLKTGTKPPELTPEEKAKKEKETAIEATLVEGTEVELDDKKYKLNKEGDIVDETGKVIKTKAEVKAMLLETENVSSEVDYISEIQKATNLSILVDGKPVTYENTLTGLTQYAQDLYNEGKKAGATENETSLFTKFPVLQNIVEHLTAYGSLDTFKEEIDYSKITVTDNEAEQIDLFTRAKKLQGLPDNEIQDMIKMYKEDKKLKSATETALTFLKVNQTTNNAKRAEIINARKVEEEAKTTAFWGEIDKALITKQLIVGDKKFNLPEVIKVKVTDGKIVTKNLKDFREYIEKPINFPIEGQIYTMTQYEFDKLTEDNKRTPHHELFDAYRLFTNYDDSQLIMANINDTQTKHIVKLKSKAGSGSSSSNTNTGNKIILPV